MDQPETNPCCAPPASVVPDESERRCFPWGIILAIPLFACGGLVLAYGAIGLLFVPGILVGSVSIGGNTTIWRIVVWVLFNSIVVGLGYVLLVAALRLFKSRWKRAVSAIGIATALLLALVTIVLVINLAG